MASLFFAFNGQNYSKYLTWFEAFLKNIDTSHPGAKMLLKKGAISVARSLVPGALCAVDKNNGRDIHEVCKNIGWSFWYFSEIFSLPKTLPYYVTESSML